jgi:hypothetical protein
MMIGRLSPPGSLRLLVDRDRGRTVLGLLDPEVGGLQGFPEEGPHHLVVVDDKDQRIVFIGRFHDQAVCVSGTRDASSTS